MQPKVLRTASAIRLNRSLGINGQNHSSWDEGSVQRGGRATDASVVVMLTLAVEAPDPASVTEAGETEHVVL
ncbi:MAG: hypothetical protein DMG26_20340, partial [Acidobacteria bacterium]